MTKHRFSLLVPCHNAARFLPRLWETVQAQTIPFDEFLCYDDASTDDTATVARSLGATVLRADTNGGASHARNQLWRAARGEWVHFHDADDLLTPAFLAKMSARATAAVDTVICAAEWRAEETRQLEQHWLYSERELLAAPGPYLLSHHVGGINGLYRRSILEAVGGFDERLKVWEDADLHVRLAVAGAHFAVVEEPLVIALRRSDSLSAPMQRNWRNRLAALRHYTVTLPADCAPALIGEIESAARALLFHHDSVGAREAVALAHSLGGDLPTTSNLVIKLCKHTLGAMAALRLQSIARHP